MRTFGRASTPASGRTVLVTGASGFIGRTLTHRLIERGHGVIALTRDTLQGKRALGVGPLVVGDLREIDGNARIDAVVNLAGAPVFGKPWTRQRRHELVMSRVGTTRDLVDWMARRAGRPEVLVSASAIGWYGAGGEAPFDEASPVGGDFRAALCNAWEREAASAEMLGLRVCRLRFGLVLGRDGGLLAGLKPSYLLGLGARLGDGQQWLSWIHLEDAVELILRGLDDPLFRGPLNATAPLPVRQGAFAAALGQALHRPVMLRIPAGLLRAGMGEMSCLLLDSQRVLPRRAQEIGFVFRFHDLETALADLYAPQGARHGATVRLLDNLLT